ncbi:MAG: S41 family peptidase [Parvularcula sp.]|jgi:hypothetical protein|nr:S41 family peptidase [Parvularcula sp.]
MTLAAFILAAAAWHAASEAAIDPRLATTEVAEVIADNFYDAERGSAIAEDLRREAASGRYEGFDDPHTLAAALTERLSPLDGHLSVMWSEPSDEVSQEGAAPVSWYDLMARQGHGFRHVEVLPGNVGLITMTNFAEIDFANPDDAARRAADAALDFVADTDAVIFDLRGNGGGSSAMTGYLVSAFALPDAEIYNRFVYREGEKSEAPEEASRRIMGNKPLFILVSARTASAGESFPYMLQAAGRAVVIGERTAGAANPGGDVVTKSGFQVFVPTGRPINPRTGTNWEGTGVVPDLEIEAEDALALAHQKALELSGKKHPDAQWTLEALKADTAVKPRRLAALEGRYGPYDIKRQDDGLMVLQDRRMPIRLHPLSADLFFVEGEPTVRFAFLRDERGQVVGVERQTAFGYVRRQTKS